MKRIAIFSFLIVSILQAVEIKIVPDTNISVTKPEIEMVIRNFLQNHLKISKKDAQKYIRENRILSNEFIKRYPVPSDLLIALRLKAEKELATLFVKKKQEKIKIDQDVLESYYKTHPKEFIQEEKIHFTAYKFPSFEEALKFYRSNGKKNVGGNTVDVTLSRSQINPLIAPLFDKAKVGELTPPVFYGGDYVVFKINKIEPAKKMSLEESKPKIKEVLLQKIFSQTKKRLIEQYQ